MALDNKHLPDKNGGGFKIGNIKTVTRENIGYQRKRHRSLDAPPIRDKLVFIKSAFHYQLRQNGNYSKLPVLAILNQH